jgi:hypothetical protein
MGFINDIKNKTVDKYNNGYENFIHQAEELLERYEELTEANWQNIYCDSNNLSAIKKLADEIDAFIIDFEKCFKLSSALYLNKLPEEAYQMIDNMRKGYQLIKIYTVLMLCIYANDYTYLESIIDMIDSMFDHPSGIAEVDYALKGLYHMVNIQYQNEKSWHHIGVLYETLWIDKKEEAMKASINFGLAYDKMDYKIMNSLLPAADNYDIIKRIEWNTYIIGLCYYFRNYAFNRGSDVYNPQMYDVLKNCLQWLVNNRNEDVKAFGNNRINDTYIYINNMYRNLMT